MPETIDQVMESWIDFDLLKQYGYLLGWREEHKERVHVHQDLELMRGEPFVWVLTNRKTESYYLVMCLDSIGARPAVEKYGVPFTPDHDFHLDKAHLWIYPTGYGEIRIEIRVPLPHRLGASLNRTVDMVYGVQVNTADCQEIRFKTV